MTILHIEHPVSDFGTWKRAFDRDPLDRKGSGVLRHRIARPVGDPNYVALELEFGGTEEAEAFLAALHERVWRSREASPALGGTPQTHIYELVESEEF